MPMEAKVGANNHLSCGSLLAVQSDSTFTYQESQELLDLPFLYPSGDSSPTLALK
ncbi:hypothetical protein OAK80_02810 [Akkermansiaceae bacterium]|nr:hypothetical protein [Akkermansiaceae bacterium]